MSFRSSGVLIAIVCVWASTAGAQGLADAAKPIDAERSESKGLVIDNSSLTRAPRTTTKTTESNWVVDSAAECVESIKEMNIVLTETATGNVFFDEDWRRRVGDSVNRFRLAQSDLLMTDPDLRYRGSLASMETAIDAAEAAVASLQAAIENNQPLYATPKKELIEAERMLEAAYSDVRAEHRAEVAEEPAPQIDPIAADRSINTLCGQRYGTGSGAFDECVANQKAAVDAIVLRGGSPYGLDAAGFNRIRNQCRFEYTDNFISRNRCEEQRIAARASR